MIKIGITGNIGSGKSTVCDVFKHMGVPVFNCDAESKKILYKNIDKIISIFGNIILDENGVFDKSKLASVVFNDKTQLKRLTDVLYPLVDEEIKNFYQLNEDKKFCAVENAILFENKTESFFDKIVTITVDEPTRLRRVMSRDKITEEQVRERLNNQLPEEYKIKNSHYIIVNHDNCDIIKEVANLLKKIETND